ncbi:type II toxin-antitoxin system VapC family toxin [Candidatus Woesearchaeota archaeon]|nr:type II toxin-antitoxin system VapC family toxin [Candidatus Woesearchaeota archaeon]
MRRTVEEIYSTPNLRIKSVTPEIPLIALDIIEQYGLKPRDAFHAAIMKQHSTEEIISDDKDFDRVKWIKT